MATNTLQKHKTFIVSLLIFFVVFGIFAKTVSNLFVYDDFFSIVYNRNVYTSLNPVNYFKNSSSYWFNNESSGIFRPLWTWLIALEIKLSRLDPFYFHIISVTLHALNAVLVFILLKNILKEYIIPFSVALLFGVHPVQTEAVAWAWQQSILWMTLLSLLSLIFLIKFIGNRKKMYIIASIIFITLSFFIKEQLILFPVLIFFLLIMLGEKVKLSFLITTPYLISSFLYFSARYFFAVPFPYHYLFSKLVMLKIMLQGFAYYILLIVYPRTLSVDYDRFISLYAPDLYISMVLLISLTILFLVSIKKRPIVAIGLFWFAISMVTVSNIIPMPQIIDDRFLYFGSIGILLALVFGMFTLFKFIMSEPHIKYIKYGILIASMFYASFFSFLSFSRLGDWYNNISLWKQTVRDNATSVRANNNYAMALHADGQLNDALLYYLMAIYMTQKSTIQPIESYWGALNVLRTTGREEKAFRLGEKINKKYGNKNRLTNYVYGRYLIKSGRFTQARKHWLEYNKKFTTDNKGLFFLILATYAETNFLDNNLLAKINSDEFKNVIPKILDAYSYFGSGSYKKSAEILKQSLEQLDNSLPVDEPYIWLAESYANIGKDNLAIATYYHLLQLNPGKPEYELAIKTILDSHQTKAPPQSGALKL